MINDKMSVPAYVRYSKSERYVVYFDVNRIEVRGEVISGFKDQLKIKTAAGNVYTRRVSQIRSFPRGK